MTQVISLRERQPRQPQPLVKKYGTAKILLFTGVRYERLADATPSQPEGRRAEPN